MGNSNLARMEFEKRPRHYAAEIIRERNRERRREMLAAVPDDCRDITEKHVRNYFELRRYAVHSPQR